MTYFIDIQLVEYYFMGGGVNCKKNKKKIKHVLHAFILITVASRTESLLVFTKYIVQ